MGRSKKDKSPELRDRGDALGDRMKTLEGQFDDYLIPLLPAVVRLDGSSFHTFTKGLERPFDPRLVQAMQETTIALVRRTGASVGYTQSDEITLLYYCDTYDKQMLYGGRVLKIVSKLAGLASAIMGRQVARLIGEDYADKEPFFDARVWNTPTLVEAANAFVWREVDAVKNSVSMAARAFYSHSELRGKKSRDMHEMLFQKGVNWNNYPEHFRRGSYVQRQEREVPFSAAELIARGIPAIHVERQLADGRLVKRADWRVIDMPPITKVKNRVDVLFFGAVPITAEANPGTEGGYPSDSLAISPSDAPKAAIDTVKKEES